MCQCRSWWGNTQTKTFSSMQQKPRTSSIISAEHTQRTETLSFNGDRGDGLYCNTAFTATSQRTWHGQVPPQKLLFLLWTMKIKQGVPLLLRYPCPADGTITDPECVLPQMWGSWQTALRRHISSTQRFTGTRPPAAEPAPKIHQHLHSLFP